MRPAGENLRRGDSPPATLRRRVGSSRCYPMPNVSPQPDIARSLRWLTALVDAAAADEAVGAFNQVRDALVAATNGDFPRRTLEQTVLDALGPTYQVSADAVEDPGVPVAVNDVISDLVRRGIDGEAVAWAVIGYESQYHIKLVWLEANRLAARLADRTPEELVGWGWLGLRIALRQFDPGLGYRFSTYACYRIKGAIRDGVRDENPVPKRLLTLQRKIADAENQLGASLGRLPQLAEVAEHLGETLAPLELLLPRLTTPASVDEMLSLSAANGSGVASALVDDADPADDAVMELRSEAVRAALAELGEAEREAVTLLVWENRSLAEARRMTGLSDRELRHRLDVGSRQLSETLAGWAPTAA
jgi:RNA polymerase sigma factor (sigma-70 family)